MNIQQAGQTGLTNWNYLLFAWCLKILHINQGCLHAVKLGQDFVTLSASQNVTSHRKACTSVWRCNRTIARNRILLYNLLFSRKFWQFGRTELLKSRHSFHGFEKEKKKKNLSTCHMLRTVWNYPSVLYGSRWRRTAASASVRCSVTGGRNSAFRLWAEAAIRSVWRLSINALLNLAAKSTQRTCALLST